MNVLKHYTIENGSVLLAGDDDTDCRAQIEMARINLWQAAACLDRVNQWSDNRLFEEEINAIGEFYHSIQDSYNACEGKPSIDLSEVLVPVIDAFRRDA